MLDLLMPGYLMAQRKCLNNGNAERDIKMTGYGPSWGGTAMQKRLQWDVPDEPTMGFTGTAT